MVFGRALTDRRLRRGAALLVLVTVIGGCGGADDPDDSKPAKIRMGGGRISSDRLQESPAKQGAALVEQGSVSKNRP
jgi:hypothetical protein